MIYVALSISKLLDTLKPLHDLSSPGEMTLNHRKVMELYLTEHMVPG
jgi:hypothetical protein